jgi:hypothetical protein
MTSATYDAALRIAQELTPEEQRQLRDELDTLLEDQTVPRSTDRPFPHHVRPGLDNDLKVMKALAEEISEEWQGDQSAVDAVREMRR